MGRRGSEARFKPGIYVFPGGLLERQDYAARPVRELDPDIPPRMAVAGSTRKASALAMAAVREAFEEAGLLFGVAGEIGDVKHDTWNEFRRRAVSPDLRELDFLGRAITPAFQPMRFHARFFSVHADHFEGELKGDGELEDNVVDIHVEKSQSPVQVFSAMGLEQVDVDVQNMLERFMPRQGNDRELPIADARRVLIEQEIEGLLDDDAVSEEAVRLASDSGIVFLDEVDKICGPEESGKGGADVSRQGVQRDLLPIIEGTTVQTRNGSINTEHILFIAAGAFHRSRPSDLMPELQGRFPIRVELNDLTRDDFVRILTEPSSSLTRQYQSLLAADGVKLKFSKDGIEAIADFAYQVNQSTQNIGARRLHTILERLLETVSYEAPEEGRGKLTIDRGFVMTALEEITKDEDLSRFIL